MLGVSDLIDTTEMYLRTIFELEEEGIVPLRARIAERLGQSGPTVSQTVARMERDGLLSVKGDRHLELTPQGRALATRVMRKHRLAECLLVDVIGLEWEQVHAEACRWEHVMSETVERRLLELLKHPTESPYGNPIPGLDELGEHKHADAETFMEGMASLPQVAGSEPVNVVIRRIGEPIQTDQHLMNTLRRAGVRPGAVVTVRQSHGGLLVGSGGEAAELDLDTAGHVFVAAR
jgi:DtxR family Mn-dependent transcriptional regulator